MEEESSADGTVLGNLDLLTKILTCLDPKELAVGPALVSSWWREVARTMPGEYFQRHFRQETGHTNIPRDLTGVQTWREAFLAIPHCPALAPCRFEARFNALLAHVAGFQLCIRGATSGAASWRQGPSRVIRNRQSLWIQFPVPVPEIKQAGLAGSPHLEVSVMALDSRGRVFGIVEDPAFAWPLSDTALMEMSHTTGLYPWDPDDEVGPAVDEGIIISGPQIMAYVHMEQLLPCLEGQIGSPQLFRLPCRPSQPASLLAFPSLAKFVLVVDWNTVRGEWLGRLTAPLSADSIGGTQCRLSTGHAESRRDGVAGLALELPGSTDPIVDPGLIRSHVDSLCQTACMVDFAAFDTSVPRGGGSVLLGRSGVELWVGEYCTTAPFMAPGQRYGSENKLVFWGWGGGGGMGSDPVAVPGHILSLTMTSETWDLLVRDVLLRWSGEGPSALPAGRSRAAAPGPPPSEAETAMGGVDREAASFSAGISGISGLTLEDGSSADLMASRGGSRYALAEDWDGGSEPTGPMSCGLAGGFDTLGIGDDVGGDLQMEVGGSGSGAYESDSNMGVAPVTAAYVGDPAAT